MTVGCLTIPWPPKKLHRSHCHQCKTKSGKKNCPINRSVYDGLVLRSMLPIRIKRNQFRFNSYSIALTNFAATHQCAISMALLRVVSHNHASSLCLTPDRLHVRQQSQDKQCARITTHTKTSIFREKKIDVSRTAHRESAALSWYCSSTAIQSSTLSYKS